MTIDRQISQAELAVMGMSSIAYVKPIASEGQLTYSVHAADGTALGVMDDLITAVEAIVENNLVPVAIH